MKCCKKCDEKLINLVLHIMNKILFFVYDINYQIIFDISLLDEFSLEILLSQVSHEKKDHIISFCGSETKLLQTFPKISKQVVDISIGDWVVEIFLQPVLISKGKVHTRLLHSHAFSAKKAKWFLDVIFWYFFNMLPGFNFLHQPIATKLALIHIQITQHRQDDKGI